MPSEMTADERRIEDYKAMWKASLARLAEAERLLRLLRAHIPSETGWGQDQLDEVDTFLRTADSAPAGSIRQAMEFEEPDSADAARCPECGQGAFGGYEWHKSGCKHAAKAAP